MDTSGLINFIKTIGQLKSLERWTGQYYWKEYPRPKRYESVADHSWRMAVMLIVLEKHLTKPLDLVKALKMSLIHDLPEIIAGDASPLGSDGTGKDSHAYNVDIARQRHESEKKAAEEIFSQLPNNDGKELFDLWCEFEEQKTFEAKVVKALDKIEAKIQSAEYLNGEMFMEHLDFNLTYGVKYFDADPVLHKFGHDVLKEFTKNFKEFKKETQ